MGRRNIIRLVMWVISPNLIKRDESVYKLDLPFLTVSYHYL